MKEIMQFIDANVTTIAAFVSGAAFMGIIWCIKKPSDWYELEEIDPDPEVELEEMAR